MRMGGSNPARMEVSSIEGSTAKGIRVIIAEKGLKQKRVAERAGFTPQEMSLMLHGRKTIKADYIPEIARALEVDANAIYDAGDTAGKVV